FLQLNKRFCILMESKTVSILEYLFVFAALTSILASFSVYHFSGLGTITLLSLILSFIVCKRSVIMAANKKEVVIFFVWLDYSLLDWHCF
ncbi:MAG: hypothetical protein IKQ05_01405, partial [Prevotella sp.]|nr:hypothetical protein [Prevotella sp.]